MLELDLFPDGAFQRSATLAAPGIRLTLTRRWSFGPMACVIGNNPSDADATSDDPTSRWWNRWFRTNGYGGYTAVNLYPFCSPDPAVCRAFIARAIAGEQPYQTALFETNPATIIATMQQSVAAFACWGNLAKDQAHVTGLFTQVAKKLDKPVDLLCWGTTNSKAPVHPMARGRSRIDPNAPALAWRSFPPSA